MNHFFAVVLCATLSSLVNADNGRIFPACFVSCLIDILLLIQIRQWRNYPGFGHWSSSLSCCYWSCRVCWYSLRISALWSIRTWMIRMNQVYVQSRHRRCPFNGEERLVELLSIAVLYSLHRLRTLVVSQCERSFHDCHLPTKIHRWITLQILRQRLQRFKTVHWKPPYLWIPPRYKHFKRRVWFECRTEWSVLFMFSESLCSVFWLVRFTDELKPLRNDSCSVFLCCEEVRETLSGAIDRRKTLLDNRVNESDRDW